MLDSPFKNRDWEKPNFFILGAQRSGTTSLWEYLRRHPDIFMTTTKEPFFLATYGATGFGSTEYTADTANEYVNLFSNASGEKRVGEATSIYYACPWVPRRIYKWFPGSKLILIIRNPIERAWSHYLKHARDGYPMFSSSFERSIREVHVHSLSNEQMRWNFGYLSLGRYYYHIKMYEDYFDKQNIKIVTFSDLKHRTMEVVRSIQKFLDVDIKVPDNINNKYNKYEVSGINILKRVKKSFWDKKPEMPLDTRKNIVEIYRNDVKNLSDKINRDLSHWLM